MKSRNCLTCALWLALLAPAAALAQDEAATPQATAAPEAAAAHEAEEAPERAWKVEGSVDVVSDYVFRGISQTNEKPALQVGASLSHSSGFYVGAWASNVDFDTPGDGINTELDYYIGWNKDLGEHLNLDLMANHYSYPGYNSGYNSDYTEFLGKLTLDEKYWFNFGYANDYVNSGESATYYQIGMDQPIGESGWTVSAAVGHYNLQNVAGDSYNDYLVGVSKTLGPVELSLSYIGTSGASEDIAPKAWTDNRLVGKISIPFEF